MTSNPNAIVLIDPQRAVAEARNRRDIVVSLRQKSILRDGVDFGKVPGTDKDTLFKPGAERLCTAFGLNPQFETIEKIERWDAEQPLFFYRVLCRLIHIESGMEIATGIGSCNSMEARYRWRKAERVCPACGNATIIKGKAEYGGGWICFAKKGGCGAKYGDKDAAIVDQNVGKVPNDDIFSLVNTIDKMACKRALVAATLIGANASEFFTQDVEDMPGFGISADGDDLYTARKDEDIVDGSYSEMTEPTVDKFAQDFPANPETEATPGALWAETKSYFHAREHFDNFAKKHITALKGRTLAEAIEYVKEKHWNWEVGRVEQFKQLALSQYEMNGEDVREALASACGHAISKWTSIDGLSLLEAHGAIVAWFAGYAHKHVDDLASEKGLQQEIVEAAHRFCEVYLSQKEAVSS